MLRVRSLRAGETAHIETTERDNKNETSPV